jgi:undecaprenyl-diphosphatase
MILSDFSTLNEIILAILLGVIQGITEFLPISSTAHMRIVSEFLVGKDFGLSTSNIIQFGSLVAILQFYFKDIKGLFYRAINILKSPRELNFFIKNASTWITNENTLLDTSTETKLDITITQLVVGTFPIIVTSLLFRGFIEKVFRQNILWIAVFLAFGSALMAFADYYFSSNKEKNLDLIKVTGENSTVTEEAVNKKNKYFTIYDVLTIGIFQSLAIFPGVSRSGATLSGALLLAKNRSESIKFSFLLSLPALFLSGIYDIFKLFTSNISQLTVFPNANNWNNSELLLSISSILLATFLAYLMGLFFLKWLLKYLANHTTTVFVLYRITLVLVILTLNVIFV